MIAKARITENRDEKSRKRQNHRNLADASKKYVFIGLRAAF